MKNEVIEAIAKIRAHTNTEIEFRSEVGEVIKTWYDEKISSARALAELKRFLVHPDLTMLVKNSGRTHGDR